MNGLFHDWWPVAAVTLLSVALALQIPFGTAFPQESVVGAVEPFASFVVLDDAEYADALQRARAPWQLRARTQLGGVESRTAAFDFNEPVPAPLSLRDEETFAAVPSPTLRAVVQHGVPALLPPSLAKSGTEGLAEAAAAANPRDADLLALPDSLLETSKEQTR